MTNPFKSAGSAVASTWEGAKHLDFMSPAVARTYLVPFVPVIAAVGFVAAFIPQPKDAPK